MEGNKKKLKLSVDELRNDTDFEKQFMKLVDQNIVDFSKEIDIHLQEENLDKIIACCHKIKFGLTMMKIENLLSILNQISLEAKKNGDINYIKLLVHRFNDEYHRKN